MTYEYLKVALPESMIALITLNRPEKRNALSTRLRQEIVNCLGELAADESIKVVILTGEGSSFCGGFDLKEFADGESESIFKEATLYHRAVHTFSKPLIAAVNGPAFAGGMDLAAMCDLRVVSEQAIFAQPQVRMGVPAAYDLISTVLPQSLARELCLSGRTMDADEARSSGFVCKIVAGERLLAESVALAAEIADAGAAGSMKHQFVQNQPDLFTN